jgi:hypothetical protein
MYTEGNYQGSLACGVKISAFALLKIGTGGWTACGTVCLPMEEPSELLASDTCPVEISGEVDTMHLHSKKKGRGKINAIVVRIKRK